jgi:hypothetical protein
MKNELEIDRQMIFEELDPLNINNDKDGDDDNTDESYRKLKYKKMNIENNQNSKRKKN